MPGFKIPIELSNSKLSGYAIGSTNSFTPLGATTCHGVLTFTKVRNGKNLKFLKRSNGLEKIKSPILIAVMQILVF